MKIPNNVCLCLFTNVTSLDDPGPDTLANLKAMRQKNTLTMTIVHVESDRLAICRPALLPKRDEQGLSTSFVAILRNVGQASHQKTLFIVPLACRLAKVGSPSAKAKGVEAVASHLCKMLLKKPKKWHRTKPKPMFLTQ